MNAGVIFGRGNIAFRHNSFKLQSRFVWFPRNLRHFSLLNPIPPPTPSSSVFSDSATATSPCRADISAHCDESADGRTGRTSSAAAAADT